MDQQVSGSTPDGCATCFVQWFCEFYSGSILKQNYFTKPLPGRGKAQVLLFDLN
jgi:hypothetical protein